MFSFAKIKAARGKGKDFYSQHLSNNDYYSEHDKIEGHWKGNLCEHFKINNSQVYENQFLSFQQNINPLNGQKLTERNRGIESVRFYDFQCSAQKSVSVMSLFDDRLIDVHRNAVDYAMRELERLACVRVRKGEDAASKKCAFTGNIVYAQYHHDNSRALDPQLHAHNVVVNCTLDPGTGTLKALETEQMVRAIRYAGKCYQNALARGCIELGYKIDLKTDDKNVIEGFEIRGVPDEVLKRCSKRRRQIDDAIERFKAEHGRMPNYTEIHTMTVQTRDRKMTVSDDLAVHRYKMSLFTDAEKRGFQQLAIRALERGSWNLSPVTDEVADRQLSAVVEQLFERDEVLSLDKVLAEVLNQNLGETDLDVLKSRIFSLPQLYSLGEPKGNPLLTTVEHFQREERALQLVCDRKGIFSPLVSPQYVPFQPPPDKFDHSAQIRVIDTILNCRDQFCIMRGVAGAGKTSTLQELCRGLGSGGIANIHLVAPTNSAVDVLKTGGFSSAQTVSMFLQDRKSLPPEGSYVIVDESGLSSLKNGFDLMNLAVERNYRVLFVGDTRQHSSVDAGDFIRLLEEHSAIEKCELSEIHRQQVSEYLQAIELASQGKYMESFDAMVANGFVKEGKGNYLKNAADGFAELINVGAERSDGKGLLLKKGDSVFVPSETNPLLPYDVFEVAEIIPGESNPKASVVFADGQRASIGDLQRAKAVMLLDCLAVGHTHAECDMLTDLIRQRLMDSRLLRSEFQRTFSSFKSFNMTIQQKRSLKNYKAGDTLFFTSDVRGVGRVGEMASVVSVNGGLVRLSNGNTLDPSNARQVAGVDFGQGVDMKLCAGDIVQFTVNVKRLGISNGTVAIATKENGRFLLLSPGGKISREVVLPEGFCGLRHGFVTTSHKSQGRTTKSVVVACENLQKQVLYVGGSRGKYALKMFVPEIDAAKTALRKSLDKRMGIHDILGRRVSGSENVDDTPSPPRDVAQVDAHGVVADRITKSRINKMGIYLSGIFTRIKNIILHKKHNDKKVKSRSAYGKGFDKERAVGNAKETSRDRPKADPGGRDR